jgi:hypothetical protein
LRNLLTVRAGALVREYFTELDEDLLPVVARLATL